MTPLLECIPNFSEGCRPNVVNAIATAIEAVPGVALLHQDRSAGANRTVMTFAGPPEAVVDAAFEATRVAAAHIDMEKQTGVHPRIGATDVCPLVPLRGMSLAEAAGYAERLSARIGAELGIPVYNYEENAKASFRKSLPQIRHGQYEGLRTKMQQPEWQPDYGPSQFNARSGATVIGARNILVAFNVSVEGLPEKNVRQLAASLRSTGSSGAALLPEEPVRGRFPALRAIGWYQPDYHTAQVSMNLLDYRITSPLQVYEAIEEYCTAAGAHIMGAELIGLMPARCLLEAAGTTPEAVPLPEDRWRAYEKGADRMHLNRLRAFDPMQQVLEEALAGAGLWPSETPFL